MKDGCRLPEKTKNYDDLAKSRHPGENRGPVILYLTESTGFRPFDKTHGPEFIEGLSSE
jgi:hypothetical protein